ncbi:hypothetical protein [Brevibacillus reuszeri]|uniref:hypothetical protein n=1 Tax=Brevibacillus reuszeri TaxID=54915 RepID=UPI00289E2B88|nr:hypothetical protein [Brevibacillus reuszeri]
MQRSFYFQVEPKTYWQLAGIVFLFVASFFTLLSIENNNRIITDEFLSEKALLTGIMYKVEDATGIDGNEEKYYSFVTSDTNLVRLKMKKENRTILTRMQQEIHFLASKESRLVFSLISLLYIMLCWLILRKHSLGNLLHVLAFTVCSYYSFSICQKWVDIRQATEIISLYLNKL